MQSDQDKVGVFVLLALTSIVLAGISAFFMWLLLHGTFAVLTYVVCLKITYVSVGIVSLALQMGKIAEKQQAMILEMRARLDKPDDGVVD